MTINEQARPTPLREHGHTSSDGLRFLDDAGLTYHDGGESEVLEILKACHDLSSTSDEMVARAGTWATRYHTDPARSNILRPLALLPNDVVLEIGAGCGALTRYLGEHCGTVDALEPMADRARCARERTRDLGHVEVFVGPLESVPVRRAYDVIVIMGVLEYVGQGSPDEEVYAAFLQRAADLLREGGTLVLGIENRLGVKYLAGAPEDHSGRSFENVQGYDEASIARTFSRRQLEAMVRATGLETTTLGAFPDYKLTRSVLHDELFELKPNLAVTTPHFPSPDWNGGLPRIANEARVWRNLVQAGIGSETSNSLLVLGHRGEGPSPRWPTGTLMTYFSSTGRRPEFGMESRMRHSPGGFEFVRRPLVEGASPDGLRLRAEPERYVEGRDLLDVIIDAHSQEELQAVLLQWRDALDRAIGDATAPCADLLPHNAVLTDDGSVVFIDAKWELPGYDRQAIVERAAVVLSQHLANFTSDQRWQGGTLGDVAREVGVLLGLPSDGRWLAPALRREARLQATLNTPRFGEDLESQVERIDQEFTHKFALPLRWLVGRPQSDMVDDVVRMEEELARVYATRVFRYSRRLRALYFRLRTGKTP